MGKAEKRYRPGPRGFATRLASFEQNHLLACISQLISRPQTDDAAAITITSAKPVLHFKGKFKILF